MASSTAFLAFAIFFTVVSLFFVALSFSTDNWLQYTVDRSALAQSTSSQVISEKNRLPWYHSRHRGLFRTCYEGNETTFLETEPYNSQRIDRNCLYLNYDIPEPDNFNLKSSDYRLRIHLMRCHVGFLITALFFLLIGCVVGAFGCWKAKATTSRYAAVVVFIGAFFTAAGMAFFHGAEYIERNKVREDNTFPLNWHSDLFTNTVRSYGWSYILGWVGMAIGAISAILYLIASWLIKQKLKDEKIPLDTYSMRSRNRAYDYMDPYANGPGRPPYGYEDPYSKGGDPGTWGWTRY
ncbi:uncharacterized protein LOC106179605 [Lingula anatina]|uniref:Uncharacterized protein LOC106179605 n=1 Tax=Lingula anatina TaxID=7574 RepID=A0A1S3K8E8_LINAN|nr:uncharacterized protein LOC106179605 [Lingula anatina]|eukprot:XP_013418772.1 uncharacterized protein LOC106179605 [Lingula anatina]